MSIDRIRKIALISALQNAIQFNGKANIKAVTGKVISVLRGDNISPKEIIPIVSSVVEKVNRFQLKMQVNELEKLAPELLKKVKKKEIFHCPSFQMQ